MFGEISRRFYFTVASVVISAGFMLADIIVVSLSGNQLCGAALKAWLIVSGLIGLVVDVVVLVADCKTRRACAEVPSDKFFLILGVLDASGLVWFFIGTAFLVDLIASEELYDGTCPLSFEVFWLVVWGLAIATYSCRLLFCMYKAARGRSIAMFGGPGSYLWEPRHREIFSV